MRLREPRPRPPPAPCAGTGGRRRRPPPPTRSGETPPLAWSPRSVHSPLSANSTTLRALRSIPGVAAQARRGAGEVVALRGTVPLLHLWRVSTHKQHHGSGPRQKELRKETRAVGTVTAPTARGAPGGRDVASSNHARPSANRIAEKIPIGPRQISPGRSDPAQQQDRQGLDREGLARLEPHGLGLLGLVRRRGVEHLD